MKDPRLFPHYDSHLRYEDEPSVPAPFDERNPFGSVLFWLSGATVGEIVTAIERRGFVTWDPFGRFVRVPPSNDGNSEHEHLRQRLKDELERYRAGELRAVMAGNDFVCKAEEFRGVGFLDGVPTKFLTFGS